MTNLRVRGTQEPVLDPSEPRVGEFRKIVSPRVEDAVRVGDVRSAEIREITAGEDDVVELELQDGIRLWTSVDRLHDLVEASGHRGTRGGELLLAGRLQLGPPTRGVGGWVIRVLKLLKVDLPDAASRAIVAKLEGQLKPEPGLYHCPSVARLGTRVTSASPLPDNAATLLFLHGTASSTSGSFGAFATEAGEKTWEGISNRYHDNIFALEHRTLSESPVANALEVARLLPERGAKLHLVSHSRGGLVGELLCLARGADGRDPFDDRALARFIREERTDELEALRELGELLKSKRPVVERFVRVACPARGTTLASRRLDLYLSVVLNLMGMIPGLRANPLYDFVSALVLAVAKKRTDPTELPGIEAMMPTSPLVALLNDPAFRTSADLAAIAGDTEGAGLFSRLKVFATDLFYRENHDLVVHTSSMVGGRPREGDARFFFDKGASVSHFNYFRNPESAGRLLGALAKGAAAAGFEPVVESTAERLRTRAEAPAPGTRPVVFLLPGMMGSELHLDGEPIWANLPALASGGFPRLEIGAAGVGAPGILDRPYARLAAYLSASHEVVELPFDWRVSIVESAGRLAEAVSAKLAATPRTVSILAHSMGGMVARAMIAHHPEVWRRMVEREGARLLMLGTPNGGSHTIARMLVGQERIVRYLAMLQGEDPASTLAVLARFPGLLEMLPADFLTDAPWSDLAGAWSEGWTLPEPGALHAARALRERLEPSADDARHMVYVAGQAPATPAGFRVDAARQGAARIRVLATARGDGRVQWSTGSLPGVGTWYMEGVPHGNLADHPPAFPALRDLLEKGDTPLLSRQPPATAGAGDTFILPPDEPVIFPDVPELVAAAVGMDPSVREEPAEEALEVAVAHGNLSFAPHPVAVGHYTGDVIAGAERVLDHHLKGRLTERRHLGLYPGPLGTSEVFLGQEATAPGAIVVGLGDVGRLTGAALERSFTQAVLSYAVRLNEQTAGTEPRRARISALLVGSGRGGISTEDSVRAIVRGTLKARELLAANPLAPPVHVNRLEFCELYEDVAIVALRAARRLETELHSGARIRVEGELVCRKGGRRRASFDDARDWWDRLQVVARGEGGLAFVSLTDRARAEKQSVSYQRSILDRFLRDITSRVDDVPELTRTLFELLMPDELKDYAPDRNKLVLILDDTAARYPWELLRDEASAAREPMAVRCGLVRQFVTEEYRERVRSPINNAVLVVGDPVTTTFPRLDGAAREATAVAEMFSAKHSVTSLVGSDFAAIVQALYARPYRVMHMAAHGVYDYPLTPGGTETVTGMVLGDGAFLRPDELKQIRDVPELVFLNCCHLGKIDGEEAKALRPGYPRLAANLAQQLIQMGVRAVVAAGWEVDDEAGVTFARAFYARMLEGRAFGDAVLAARGEAYHRHPGINTWGAYQCYGDPGFVLARPSEADLYDTVARTDFTCAREVEIELANFAENAETTAQQTLPALAAQLEQIVSSLPAKWREEPGVIAGIARAHAELDQFEAAIEWYDRLPRGEKADYAVATLEQLANLRGRLAARRWADQRAAGQVAPDPNLVEEVRRSIADLEKLPWNDTPPAGEAGSRSSERNALLGSAHKRLSWMLTGASRDEELAGAALAYRAAHETRGAVAAYPLTNWLSVLVVMRLRGLPTPDVELPRLIDDARLAAARQEATSADFWSGVGQTDADLVAHLHAGDLDRYVEEIVLGYRRAWRRGGTARKLASVMEHLGWLADVLAEPVAGAASQAAQAGALRHVVTSVRSFLDTGEG